MSSLMLTLNNKVVEQKGALLMADGDEIKNFFHLPFHFTSLTKPSDYKTKKNFVMSSREMKSGILCVIIIVSFTVMTFLTFVPS